MGTRLRNELLHHGAGSNHRHGTGVAFTDASNLVDAVTHRVPADNQQRDNHQQRCQGVGAHRVIQRHQHQHNSEEHHHSPVAEATTGCAVVGALVLALTDHLQVLLVRHCDSRPARHGAHRRDVQHDLERLLGNEEVQHNTEEANHTGQQNTCHRNAGAGHLGGELRCRTRNTHRVENTAGGVQASVQRGSSRGNNDQLHNRCGTVNAD